MGQKASINISDETRNDESLKTMTKKEWKIPPPSNPLLIELVLDQLLGIVNKEDLPACRLVCKLWNLQSIPRFRREFEICPRLSPYPDPQRESLKEFVRLMRTSMALPYTKFQMCWLNVSTNERFIHEFFSTWGSQFTHLTLENWTLARTDIGHLSPHPYSIRCCFFIEDFDELIKFSTNLVYLCIHTPLFLRESYPGPWKPKPRLSSLKLLIFISTLRFSNENSSNDGLLLQELRARCPNGRIIIEYND